MIRKSACLAAVVAALVAVLPPAAASSPETANGNAYAYGHGNCNHTDVCSVTRSFAIIAD